MRIKAIALVLVSFTLAQMATTADASVKAGSVCAKPGGKAVVSGYKYTCNKSGDRLLWSKAVKVAVKATPTSTPTPTPTLQPVVDSLAPCRLPVADGQGAVSIGGWPRIGERSKVLGDVTATVILVDFPDAPATMTPAEAFARISPAADVFKEMSYGKLHYNLKPQLKWYRMSRKSSDYVAGGWTFLTHRDYITEAAKLADADVDFSKTDSLIILANPDASGMGNSGPAFAAISGNGITLDGKYISNGATSAYD